ncbi:fungal-specific transcription factor domain protein [Rhizoctonia solani AG-3 Rhs1AP]|uniref:Fungal-specific transcription factor domain protein n=1 Tax=Rhizoctonia solani AG-3 Rhs1AP TaxID=1086054 RepID=X8IVY8_9AGAM|nr:fungal-specific transcription factor domain protein [Rhizoctonia solani AG-3 Rhs1AP]
MTNHATTFDLYLTSITLVCLRDLAANRMTSRAHSGCITCKTSRKTCDETRPKCQRCAKFGIECGGYSSVDQDGSKFAKRGPHPRLTPEVALWTPGLSLSPAPNLGSFETPLDTFGAIPPFTFTQPQETSSEAGVGELSGPSTQLSNTPSALDSRSHLDTDQHTLLHSSSKSMLGSPITIEIIDLTAPPFNIPETQPPQSSLSTGLLGSHMSTSHGQSLATTERLSLAIARAPTKFTPGQASLYEALFSLEENTYASPLLQTPSMSRPRFSSASSSSSQSRSPWASPDVDDDTSDTSEDDDRDNAKQIWCSSPMMDSSIPTNSLPYVLQSYATWLNYTTFEPLRLVHPTKECVVAKFASSQESRNKIILIANAMSMLRRTRNPRGVSLVSMLASQVHETIALFKSNYRVTPGSEQENARAALDHIVEILGVQLYSSPLSAVIRLLEDTAPVFRSACPEPLTQLVSLPDLLLGPWVHLRYFAVTDVTLSITTGRPMFFRYDVEFSLELCERMTQRKANFGLTWMHGMPDELVLLFAWMNNLREEAQLGIFIDEEVVARIENDIQQLQIVPGNAADPTLKVTRLVVQECWRQVAYIYLYMALCGAHAQDARVQKHIKAFMKLVNGTAPGRNPDAFLVVPAVIAGIAATKPVDRKTLRTRLSGLPECKPGTCRHDSLRVLEDVWNRTAGEGRPAVWEDLRVSCLRISGL